MFLIYIKKFWEIFEREIILEKVYVNCCWFMKNLIGIGISFIVLFIFISCVENLKKFLIYEVVNLLKISNFIFNYNFVKFESLIIDEVLGIKYNNFYEFGGIKFIWKNV